MRRTPAKLIAVAVAVLGIGATGIAAASAQLSAAASHHGSERFTALLTSTRNDVASVIATGLFTDGGTINLAYPGKYGELKLAGGTIWISTATRGGLKTSRAACLRTETVRGTYKLVRATGKYAGIRGAGHANAVDRFLSRRKAHGGCVNNPAPLAVQAVITLSGTATLSG